MRTDIEHPARREKSLDPPEDPPTYCERCRARKRAKGMSMAGCVECPDRDEPPRKEKDE